jgi:hypothetical protein
VLRAVVVLGLLFQYFAIVPMRGVSFRAGIVAAVKAGVLSLTAFALGRFSWMAFRFRVLSRPADATRPARCTGSS